MIRKGDKVTRKADGRTGVATRDEYTAFAGWQAVVIRWDGSTRVPVPSRADKLVRCSTVGCKQPATASISYDYWYYRNDGETVTESVCGSCAESLPSRFRRSV